MLIDLRVEIALHNIFLVVPIVCACPTAWGIGNVHQAAAVEKDFFLVLVLISVKSGLYLRPWANVVIDLRVEIALHDIFLLVLIVCMCPAAWGIGDLHQTAAVEDEPCPSAVGSRSPGVVELVEDKYVQAG